MHIYYVAIQHLDAILLPGLLLPREFKLVRGPSMDRTYLFENYL